MTAISKHGAAQNNQSPTPSELPKEGGALSRISRNSSVDAPAEKLSSFKGCMRLAGQCLLQGAFWLGGAAVGATLLGLVGGPLGVVLGALAGFLIFPGLFITSQGNPPAFNAGAHHAQPVAAK